MEKGSSVDVKDDRSNHPRLPRWGLHVIKSVLRGDKAGTQRRRSHVQAEADSGGDGNRPQPWTSRLCRSSLGSFGQSPRLSGAQESVLCSEELGWSVQLKEQKNDKDDPRTSLPSEGHRKSQTPFWKLCHTSCEAPSKHFNLLASCGA